MKRLFSFPGAIPQVIRSDLRVTGLPASLKGRRILFLSDIHYGFCLTDEAMRQITDCVMKEKADLILLGGDLAWGYDAQKRLTDRHLSRLSAPLGMYAVPGNNDYEAFRGDYRQWADVLSKAGVTLLVNRRADIRVDGACLTLFGLDESKYGHPRPEILRVDGEKSDVTVLMLHSPWGLESVIEGNRRMDLVLCGHTHGGQFALGTLLPSLAMGYIPSPKHPYYFLSGDRIIRGTRILVSNGIGCSRIPLRIGAEPQIHVIMLA